ncbi:transcription termination factor Rho [Aeromicrobium sp. 179-A 4D2 NHS]
MIAELQEIAAGLGIEGAAKMRKGQLIDAIKAARGDAKPAEAPRASQDTLPDVAPEPKATRRGRAPKAAKAEPVAETQEKPAEQPQAERADQGERPEKAPKADQQDTPDTADATSGRSEKQDKPEKAEKSDEQGDKREGRQGGERNRDRNRGEGQDRNRGEGDRNRQGGEQGDRNRQGGEQGDRGQGNRNRNERNDRNDRNDRNQDDEGGRRRNRRGRNRGGSRTLDDNPTYTEDDVLVPAAGILDIHDNYAFVRTTGYLPSENDVYVSMSLVRKLGLRRGDAITGQVRQPREGERKEKFNPMVKVDSVNGMDADEAKRRVDFSKLTPLYPSERLRLESQAGGLTGRVIDLVSPIGKGQRGLIVSPPKAGKTMVMQQVANAITENNPECHLMIVLVDERPEEVTDFQRTVKGEVIASTFDRPAADHTTVAELAIERAKRLVELGHDVVVLLDGITRLGRAYNLAAPASGRIMSGGVDSSALYPPKKFFGAARNIEDGGSLTILATALIETGSRMDEVIFEEFKGTGNWELRLRREFADKRIFPAIDVEASSTRREELLMARDELAIVWKLRRLLSGLEGQQGLELILGKLKKTQNNVEFLMELNKTMPGATNDGN